MYEVTIIEHDGKSITLEARPYMNLLDLLRRERVFIPSTCGGAGICGKCKIRVVEGTGYGITEQERELLSDREIEAGIRLACMIEIDEDITIQTVNEFAGAGILIDKEGMDEVSPAIQKQHISLPPPSMEDRTSDVERIEAGLGHKSSIPYNVMGELSEVLRNDKYSVTISLFYNDVVSIESGDTRDRSYGIAVDIGTTSIAGFLMELNTGRQIDIYSTVNPQVKYGGDIITRIDYTIGHGDGLSSLSDMIRREINDMIEYFCAKWSIHKKQIYHITLSGNTVMLHLFANLPVDHIAVPPFTPVVARTLHIPARDLDINICPDGRVTLLPMIAGYIGADTISAVLASGMYKSEKMSLLVDVGTNGEIVLGNKDGFISCSASAGPAFEGARIRCGMAATGGAINKIKLSDGDIVYATIMDRPSQGICGSGLVDGVAIMLKLGILDAQGKMMRRGEEGTLHLSTAIQDRLCEIDGQAAFIISREGEVCGSKDVYICQKDVRELQLAKAGIAAGIRILMNEYKLDYEDVGRVYLSGGFGNYMDQKNSILIGLIPEELKYKIKTIGNASGRGAKMALLSKYKMAEIENIRGLIKYVEVSARSDFQDIFADMLSFP